VYANSAKTRLLGVSEDTLRGHGAVSAEAAEALARGVRDRFGSSLGLAVTGIAGPGGATAEKPIGLVYIGVADGMRSAIDRRLLPGDREAIRERAAFFALATLRRFLHEQTAEAQ